MRYRTFGKTGWSVSEIGYGAWGIGKSWWGPTEDALSLKALHHAMDLGLNFIDTAYVYGDGHSERLIAQALKECPTHGVIVSTKIPPKNMLWPAKDAPCREAFPKNWIIQCTERSLRNLSKETLDLQQFHVWADRWTEEEEWRKGIETLKQSGKIRAFGISINDHDPQSALRLVREGLVDSVQTIFNLFDQSPVAELFPACRKTDTAIIIRVPLDEGGLSGKLTPQSTFHAEDFRGRYFRGERLLETGRRVEKLSFLIREEIQSIPQAALKFCLSHPEVTTVIPGMRRPEHVTENCSVSDGKFLTEAELKEARKHAWQRNFYL